MTTASDSSSGDAAQVAHIVLVHAGVSDPSTTQLVADRLANQSLMSLRKLNMSATLGIVALSDLAVDIAKALVSGITSEPLRKAIDSIAIADALIAATPVYKAGISGLFKAFFDVLDNDLIIATPVALVTSVGSARHALVADDHLRPLFAFMRALTVPTSVSTAPSELSSPELTKRIERAARELATLIELGVREKIQSASWGAYEHTFAGSAERAQRDASGVNFDTDLMRLARGEK